MIRPGTVWVWEEGGSAALAALMSKFALSLIPVCCNRGNEYEALDRWSTMGSIKSWRWRVLGVYRVSVPCLVYIPKQKIWTYPWRLARSQQLTKMRLRTNENISPPTSHDMYDYHRQSSKEPLIKQTYSTSMTDPTNGKTEKFHVVAYSSKVSIPTLSGRSLVLISFGGVLVAQSPRRRSQSSTPTSSAAATLYHHHRTGYMARMGTPTRRAHLCRLDLVVITSLIPSSADDPSLRPTSLCRPIAHVHST